MRIYRISFFLVLFLTLILVGLPWGVGIILQRYLPANIMIAGDAFTLQVGDYKRGWFSSDVMSIVSLKSSNLKTIFPAANFPQPIQFVLKQHIQHGPIFYAPLSSLPSLFGWAAINNKWKIYPFSQAIFKELGFYQPLLLSDQAVLSFTGNYINRIKINNYRFDPSQVKLHIYVDGFQSDINYHLLSHRLLGDIVLTNVSIDAETDVLSLPELKAHFDLKKDANGLWVGKHAVALDEIVLRDDANKSIRLTGLVSDGELNEKNNELSATKTFSIKQLQFTDQVMGPIEFDTSLKGINADGLRLLLQTYQDIRTNGELYASQLRQNMLALLPKVVNSGTLFKIDKLLISTPKGRFNLQASLSWPKENTLISSFEDLTDAAVFQMSVRLTSALVDDALESIAKLIFIYQLSPDQRNELLQREDDIALDVQRYGALMDELVASQGIIKSDAEKLMESVKSHVSYEDYAIEVKNLLLQRKLQLVTSYLLNWQYHALATEIAALEDLTKQYQDATVQLLQAELTGLLRQGYVAQEQGDYVTSMLRKNGSVTINGRVWPPKE